MAKLSRRKFIALGSTAFLTGCLSSQQNQDKSDTNRQNERNTTIPPESETATRLMDTMFVDMPCPNFDKFNKTICYHTTQETEKLYVRPSSEQVEVGSKITFILENNTTEGFNTGCNWQILQQENGVWKRVNDNQKRPDLGIFVPPGQDQSWTFKVDENSFNIKSNCGNYSIPHDGIGKYLFVQQGSLENSSELIGLVSIFMVI